MSLFGHRSDFELFRVMSRELVNHVIEQTVGYYKVSLKDTQSNIYGESSQKVFHDPVKLNCLITRGDQVITSDEFGQDMNRQSSFAFLKDAFESSQMMAEVGDIIFWNGDYYEVDTVRENQLFLGNDNDYSVEAYQENYGSSISIICDAHLTRADKLGLEQVRF